MCAADVRDRFLRKRHSVWVQFCFSVWLQAAPQVGGRPFLRTIRLYENELCVLRRIKNGGGKYILRIFFVIASLSCTQTERLAFSCRPNKVFETCISYVMKDF